MRSVFLGASAVFGLSLILSGCNHGKDPVPAPPAAAVVIATRGNLANTLTVAGQFQPYQEVDLHAKVSGYIRNINVDIGDKVKRGQVLAVLEVPELDAQLQGTQAAVRQSQSEILHAQEEIKRNESTHVALHAAYERLDQAAKARPGLVAQQELDDAFAKDQAAEAQVEAAKSALDAATQQLGVSQADSARVKTLAEYSSIIAPFTGVITMRYADTGSLIQAGTSSDTQSMPVVRIAQSDLLRLRMPVPESDVPYIQQGGDVQVRIDATGQTLTAKIIRFTRALDASTRTMLTEVDIPNESLKLSPGMFAETTIQLQQRDHVLLVPAQAVMQNSGHAQVLIVDVNNKVQERDVTLGIQGPNRIEITSGLNDGDQVVASGQTRYKAGETVRPKIIVPLTSKDADEGSEN
jgi:RND family efflux transporter MFP subunit